VKSAFHATLVETLETLIAIRVELRAVRRLLAARLPHLDGLEQRAAEREGKQIERDAEREAARLIRWTSARTPRRRM